MIEGRGIYAKKGFLSVVFTFKFYLLFTQQRKRCILVKGEASAKNDKVLLVRY